MLNDILEIEGAQSGPVSIVLVGVHGNEKCGVVALDRILPDLKIARGKVIFCLGNPEALKKDSRYMEANLNRMFVDKDALSDSEKSSYEYERAQFIKKYLDQAGVLLDVHSSNSEDSRPFIVCEDNAMEIARGLPFDLVVSGFDDQQPGGTDYYMNKNGKIGICIECGSTSNDSSADVAEESIRAFLDLRGHTSAMSKELKLNQSQVRLYEMYKTKTDNFTLSKNFADFEELPPNQVIGVDGDEIIKTDRASVILFARDRNHRGAEAFVLGEFVNH